MKYNIFCIGPNNISFWIMNIFHHFEYVILTKINAFAFKSVLYLLLRSCVIFLVQLLLDFIVTIDCICLIAKCAEVGDRKPGNWMVHCTIFFYLSRTYYNDSRLPWIAINSTHVRENWTIFTRSGLWNISTQDVFNLSQYPVSFRTQNQSAFI